MQWYLDAHRVYNVPAKTRANAICTLDGTHRCMMLKGLKCNANWSTSQSLSPMLFWGGISGVKFKGGLKSPWVFVRLVKVFFEPVWAGHGDSAVVNAILG